MRFILALRKFNTVAFAIVLIIAMILGGLALNAAVRDMIEERALADQQATESKISGENVKSGDRVISIYQRGSPSQEFSTDLRFVDIRTGAVKKLGRDHQEMYAGTIMGQSNEEADGEGYGYFVLAKTGEANKQPKFDVLFLRFSDMQTFKLASNVLAADQNQLDQQTFSLILWNADDKGMFALFDVPSGKIVVSRSLDSNGKHWPNLDVPPPKSRGF